MKRASKDTTTAVRIALELETLQRLRTIFGSARTHDNEVRRSAGISGSLLWALSEITRSAKTGGITVNGLSDRMALHQTTTSNLINHLVKRQLVRRERDSVDHRIVHLKTTPAGKQVLLKTPAPHAGLLVDALHRLDRAQLRELSKNLQWIVDVMHSKSTMAAGETLMGE